MYPKKLCRKAFFFFLHIPHWIFETVSELIYHDTSTSFIFNTHREHMHRASVHIFQPAPELT